MKKKKTIKKERDDVFVYRQKILDILWTEISPMMNKLADTITVESIKSLLFNPKKK